MAEATPEVTPDPPAAAVDVAAAAAAASPAATPPADARTAFVPLICVVDFHHARGPEIEHWIGAEAGSDPTSDNDWHLIPYMALPDGAHQNEEEFSYFSLIYKGRGSAEPTSVFGISCTHQIPSDELRWKSEDVTRSAVQKAVVAITDQPQSFSALREKLSVVTQAWFAQKDFRELDILQRFQETLAKSRLDVTASDGEKDQYFGLSLREIVHEYKWQTLVLFKSLLLQPKMLFFGSHCERVCQVQFTLLSLIPGLIRNLHDCADPHMDRYTATVKRSDSVRTSDRESLLAYMGLPLHLFGKGSVFGPYTPLQQLDILTDLETRSYVVGSTNSLLVQQRDRYCDVLVDLDENAAHILLPALKAPLILSVADRRWVDFLTNTVNDTWDETDPSRPKTHGYAGSEEFIRLQFEEYLLAMLSATKYHQYLIQNKDREGRSLLADIDGDPSTDFSLAFIEAWQRSENYKLWNRITDSHIFDIVEPRHPCAGGLTIDDVQRRLAAQVAELHLDERFNQTRDVVNKRLADGRSQVSSAFTKVWADIEAMREAQRKRSEEARAAGTTTSTANGDGTAHSTSPPPLPARFQKPDLHQAQASVTAAGQRASAYFSSWGAWAAEKRKSGWGGGSAASRNNTPPAGVAGFDLDSKAARPVVGQIEKQKVENAITKPEAEAWSKEARQNADPPR